MSAQPPTRLRALSFGDVEGGLWGAAFHAGVPAIVFAAGGVIASAGGEDAISWTPDGRGWRLAGAGFDLHVVPGGEAPAEAADPERDREISGFEELCRVRGTISPGGVETEIDCVGTRSVVDGVDDHRLSSARAVSSWFADDNGLAVLSLRPGAEAGRGGRGGRASHETDLVAGTLFYPEGWVAVEDPRLSTTYAGSGVPLRANLELWVGDADSEFPRRAAGEATGEGAAISVPGLELRVVPLRCHSRGLEGSGVYVLAGF
jgi:hypothetical protein